MYNTKIYKISISLFMENEWIVKLTYLYIIYKVEGKVKEIAE